MDNIIEKIKKIGINNILNIIGIIVGIVIIYCSLTFYVSTSFESPNVYGGDAYTGIQQAAAQTATNVDAIGDSLEELVKIFGTSVGIIVIIHYLKNILNSKTEIIKDE